MNNDDIYYYHLRIGHGVTFAYYVRTNGWVQFSYAICSKKDQYCKAVGRDIAEERLLHSRQNKVSGFQAGENVNRFNVLKTMVTNFLTDVKRQDVLYIKSSSWLRRIVKDNLSMPFVDPVTEIVNAIFFFEKDSLKAAV
jgi:hypothetical protein